MVSGWQFKPEDIPVEPTQAPPRPVADSLLRDIVESTGEVAYRIRFWPTLSYEFISDSILSLVGYSADEVYADPMLAERIIYPDDRELMREVMAAPDGHEVEVRLRWVRRDGRIVSTELRCVLTRDTTGRPLWLDGVVRDTTLRDENRQRMQLIHWRGASRAARGQAPAVRVLVAEDYELTRAGLRLLLSQDPGLELVAEAEDGLEAVELAQTFEPDLALVSLELKRLDGLQAIRRIKQVSPTTRVIVLSTSVDAQLLLESVKAGAAGYLLKNANESALRSAIWEALSGEIAIDQQLVRDVLRQIADEPRPQNGAAGVLLSTRERDVVRLLARGYTNREIAENLTITASTVKIHVEHILAKLGVTDRTQAAVRAIELGLVATERSQS
jgi:PAS domain S-box-containing protein